MKFVYVFSFLAQLVLLFCFSWQIKSVVKNSYIGAIISTALISICNIIIILFVAKYIQQDYIVGICIVIGSVVGVLINMRFGK